MQKINLLYVEDNPFTALVVKRHLEKNNFAVKIATNGESAWELFNVLSPEIILLDIEIPKKNGFEILKLIRQKDRHIPIVIYSSYLSPDRELKTIDEGADDCISKNASPELLVAKLRRIYERVTQGEKAPRIYRLSPRVKFYSSAAILYVDNNEYHLSAPEARLLRLLCVKYQEISSYDYLLAGLWGKALESRMPTLRKYIFALNQKIAPDPTLVLKSERDLGYFFGRVFS
ncbi:response regulator transcription factor [Butyricimonas paravirosa]